VLCALCVTAGAGRGWGPGEESRPEAEGVFCFFRWIFGEDSSGNIAAFFPACPRPRSADLDRNPAPILRAADSALVRGQKATLAWLNEAVRRLSANSAQSMYWPRTLVEVRGLVATGRSLDHRRKCSGHDLADCSLCLLARSRLHIRSVRLWNGSRLRGDRLCCLAQARACKSAAGKADITSSQCAGFIVFRGI